MTSPEVSVVVPIYLSQNIIPTLLARLSTALSGVEYEIILVNDCSPDDSWGRIKELAPKFPTMRALCLRKNFGYDNAIMAGLKHARGQYIVTMDDDLQHAPEDIPKLLADIKRGYDVVYANLWAERKKHNRFKNLGSWLNGKLAELIIQKPADIYLSPFKVLTRGLVDEVIKYEGPYPYVDGLIFQNTSLTHQIPITHHARIEGRGNHGLFRSLKIMANFCTSHSILPLRLSVFLGFFISFCGALFGLFLLYWKYVERTIDVEGWASTIFTILLMGGVHLISLGIIGEYLGRTYTNVSRHPQYVIRESIGEEPV